MPVIKVENLSKKYIINHQSQESYSTLRDTIVKKMQAFNPFTKKNFASSKKEEFWALKDVSFNIKYGDRIGIIGKNGAGKSTLLKLLSRITEPTTGSIYIRGRVASLLEVGTGFHPELTGRENVFLNAAILGLTKKEIKKKFDEIIAFAEIENFLDTPVKRYSSGMYVRLAFAVAAHIEPEILIVDEVLAVGDSEFQKKCLNKMDNVGKDGRTVIFVSHNMAAVSAFCNRGILLKGGRVLCDTNVQECISKYQERNQAQKRTKDLGAVKRIGNGTGEALIKEFSIRNVDSNNHIIDAEKPCVAELTFEVLKDNLNVGGEFLITDGIQSYSLFHSYLRNGLVPVFKKGLHTLVCYTDPISLYSGTYYVTLALSRPGVPIDYLENAVSIDIELSPRTGSTYEYKRATGSHNVYIEHKWEIKD